MFPPSRACLVIDPRVLVGCWVVNVNKLLDLIIDECLKANLSMLSGVVAHIGRVRDAILDRFAKEFNSDVDFHAFRGPLVISPTIVLVYLLSFSLRYVERSFW